MLGIGLHCLRQPFDLAFKPGRQASIANFSLEHERQGSLSAQVFRAFRTILMFRNAPCNVRRNARVIAAIATPQKIEAVHGLIRIW